MKFHEIKPFVRLAQKLKLDSSSRFQCMVPCEQRLFFCTEGEGEIEAGEAIFKMQKGSLTIIPSGWSYRLITPQDKVSYISINFDYTFNMEHMRFPIHPISAEAFTGAEVLERVEFSDATELNRPLYLPRVHRVENKLNKILAAYLKKVIFYEVELSGLISQVLAECLRCLKLNALNRRDSVFDDVFEYIHENCHRRLTNKEIAETFGYNPNYISDLLKISTGLSLHRYLLNVRIEKAIELLESGDRAVGMIAEECGFYDIYHFSKAFKTATGVSPTKYRKS